jgi:hypothetical protein
VTYLVRLRGLAANHESYEMQSTVFMVAAHCGLMFFVATSLNSLNARFCRSAVKRMFSVSWGANKALNFLRASSSEFNTSFFLEACIVPIEYDV